MKCKDRVVAATNKSVWWYIVHADEEVLCDLETKWESIQLQLKWKLEHCFMFKETTDPGPSSASDDDSQPTLARQAQSALLNTDSIHQLKMMDNCLQMKRTSKWDLKCMIQRVRTGMHRLVPILKI